jgi:hypothetical protein
MRGLAVSFPILLMIGLILASAVSPTVAIGQTQGAQPRPPLSLTPLPAATQAPMMRPSAPPGGALITVPGGTIVEVSLVEPISSATAQVGDQVAVRVTKEVDIGGWLVIPEGSPGHATVTMVDRAGSNGHGGQLGISIDWVFSEDGGRIALSPTSHASENGQQKGAASTATILSYVFLGPIGLFAHNFVRGRDVTLDTNKVFTVFVDHDVVVGTAAKATNPNAGFDRPPHTRMQLPTAFSAIV